MVSDLEVYSACMADIKFRLNAVYSDYAVPAAETGVDMTKFESACLQFRISIELLAFATLAGERDRWTETYQSFAVENNFVKLLRRLERLNSNFLPTSVVIHGKGPDGLWRMTDGEVQLSRQELVRMHGWLGNVLHARNPYNGVLNHEEQQDIFRGAQRRFRDYLQRHVAIFANGRHALVSMGGGDEDVSVYQLTVR